MPDGSDDPVAQRLVDRRAQRLVAAGDRHHARAEQPHAADVRRLALHVDRAHVDGAGQAEARAGRRARHAVLAGAGLGDDALRAEPLREQRLAERVVDLVRAGVREVLALEPDLRAPGRGQPRREASAPWAGRPRSAARRRAAPGNRRDAGARGCRPRGDRAPGSASPARSGRRRGRSGRGRRGTCRAISSASSALAVRRGDGMGNHRCSSSAGAHAPRCTNSRISAGAFTPGCDSTPLETSTPNGRTLRDGRGRRWRRRRPPASTSSVRAASSRGARPVGGLAGAADRALEQQRAPAAAAAAPRAGAHHRQHRAAAAPGSQLRQVVGISLQQIRLRTPPGSPPAAAASGCCVTATQVDAAARRRRELARPARASTRRTDGANTKPIASTPAASAASTASGSSCRRP